MTVSHILTPAAQAPHVKVLCDKVRRVLAGDQT